MDFPPHCFGTGAIYLPQHAAEACCDDCPYASKCVSASADKVPARRWLCEQLPTGIVHVLPLDDNKAHIKSAQCPCGYHVVPEGHGVFVHRSYDRREEREGQRIR